MHGDRLITRFPFLLSIFPDSFLSLNFYLFYVICRFYRIEDCFITK